MDWAKRRTRNCKRKSSGRRRGTCRRRKILSRWRRS
jgi:hypothetical protein